MRCVVIQTAFLGDVVLTIPLLDLLARLPDLERLTVVATPVGAEFLAGQGVAHDVVTYDKRRADAGAGGFLRAARRLRDVRADAAVIPHRSMRSALLALAARIPERIGFDESGGRLLLSRRVRYRAEPHEIERLAGLAGALGVPPAAARIEFRVRVPPGGAGELGDLMAARGVSAREGLAAIAPGSRWPTKRWPPDRFGEAAAALARDPGLVPVVTGTADERDVGRAAASAAGHGVVDLTGELSLAGWVALLARARVVISNDSASAHVAAGVGTPVVAVFGPTAPSQGFAPYSDLAEVIEPSVACRPCGRHGAVRCPLGTLECMRAVPVSAVVDAARRIVGKAGGG